MLSVQGLHFKGRVILGFYIGIMENKLETTIYYNRVYIRVILVLRLQGLKSLCV